MPSVLDLFLFLVPPALINLKALKEILKDPKKNIASRLVASLAIEIPIENVQLKYQLIVYDCIVVYLKQIVLFS